MAVYYGGLGRIGLKHWVNQLPYQDKNCHYSFKLGNEQVTIISVADGHGGLPYFRSAKGAEIASQNAAQYMEEFIKNYHDKLDRFDEINGILNKKIYSVCDLNKITDENRDELYDRVKKYITESDLEYISVSAICRIFCIGFSRASKYMQLLQDDEIVENLSQSKSYKGCKILVKTKSINKLRKENETYKRILDVFKKSFTINEKMLKETDENALSKLRKEYFENSMSLSQEDASLVRTLGIEKISNLYNKNNNEISDLIDKKSKENKLDISGVKEEEIKLRKELQSLKSLIEELFNDYKKKIKDDWTEYVYRELEAKPLNISDFDMTYASRDGKDKINSYSQNFKAATEFIPSNYEVDYESAPLTQKTIDNIIKNPVILYGTTLLVAANYKNHNFLLSIGDSDVTVIDKSGKEVKILEKLPGQILNFTNSMCQVNAVDNMQFAYFYGPLKMIMLSTDGIANGLDSNDSLVSVANEMHKSMVKHPESFYEDLLETLYHCTEVSGDDCTTTFIAFDIPKKNIEKFKPSITNPDISEKLYRNKMESLYFLLDSTVDVEKLRNTKYKKTIKVSSLNKLFITKYKEALNRRKEDLDQIGDSDSAELENCYKEIFHDALSKSVIYNGKYAMNKLNIINSRYEFDRKEKVLKLKKVASQNAFVLGCDIAAFLAVKLKGSDKEIKLFESLFNFYFNPDNEKNGQLDDHFYRNKYKEMQNYEL